MWFFNLSANKRLNHLWGVPSTFVGKHILGRSGCQAIVVKSWLGKQCLCPQNFPVVGCMEKYEGSVQFGTLQTLHTQQGKCRVVLEQYKQEHSSLTPHAKQVAVAVRNLLAQGLSISQSCCSRHSGNFEHL